MSDTVYTVAAEAEDAGTRLDKFLAAKLPELSRSRVQALIEQGCITSAGATITDASAKVKPLDAYVVAIPDVAPSHIVAQDIALNIVFEDEHLLVINKPAGLTVHPAPGHPDNTLVNALLAHCGATLSGIGGVARPGIVHRIDKETSGLLVVAKHDAAHAKLSAQLADRTLSRRYVALTWGTMKPAKGTITGGIGRSPSNRQKMAIVKSGGREATTHYTVLQSFHQGAIARIECKLETGRTHQIRVHCLSVGHPLLGDPVYGQTTASRLLSNPGKSLPDAAKQALLNFKRQALHARALGLVHPASNEAMEFSCPLPEDMQTLEAALQKD